MRFARKSRLAPEDAPRPVNPYVTRLTPGLRPRLPLNGTHFVDISVPALAQLRARGANGILGRISSLPFPDGAFDLVTGYSVMTHLTRENQVLWLEELRRILRPGALCLLTLHGEGAAEFLGPKFLALLREKGIDDGSLDPVLDSIAPAGYYRATYQSRDYTIREFSRFFDVLEYLDRGMFFQDLIVLRRRA
jgi:SAM-dependent methyltransferase